MGLIEGGMSHRDAVAKLFKDNRHVIFTGNGYSSEWPVEAAKRGLPNLNTTPLAVATFNSPKAKSLFSKMGIFSAEECDARAEVMFETGILPACAKDMAKYQAMPSLAGERQVTYDNIKSETDKLKQLFDKRPHELQAEAKYL